MKELTGRRRYRKNLWTLVLQVEETEWKNGDKDTLGKWVCRWRDADVTDVVESELA